jgi:tetratricopeptide (TPR) repeat protein
LVICGALSEAVHYGEESVELARRSGDRSAYINSLSSAADALHQIGDLTGARRLFEEGIRHQEALQNDEYWKRHFTLQGYHYCCFELSCSRPHVVERWCRKQIDLELSQSISLLTFALDHISLGRAILTNYEAGRLSEARDYIEKGYDLVRQGQDASFLPAGLLARAELLRMEGDLFGAIRAVDSAVKIASRGSGMPLYLIDAEIERANLSIAEGRESEQQILRSIARLESDMLAVGYGRRMRDIAALKNRVRERFGNAGG